MHKRLKISQRRTDTLLHNISTFVVTKEFICVVTFIQNWRMYKIYIHRCFILEVFHIKPQLKWQQWVKVYKLFEHWQKQHQPPSTTCNLNLTDCSLNAPKNIDMSTDKNFLAVTESQITIDVNSMDLRCSGCHGYYSSNSFIHSLFIFHRSSFDYNTSGYRNRQTGLIC